MTRQGIYTIAATLALAAAPLTTRADEQDVEGLVDGIDAAAGWLTVGGVKLVVDGSTDFDDGLKGLADIKAGDRVEVDYVTQGDQKIAREIEKDD